MVVETGQRRSNRILVVVVVVGRAAFFPPRPLVHNIIFPRVVTISNYIIDEPDCGTIPAYLSKEIRAPLRSLVYDYRLREHCSNTCVPCTLRRAKGCSNVRVPLVLSLNFHFHSEFNSKSTES